MSRRTARVCIPFLALASVLVCASAPADETKTLEDFPRSDRLWLCHVKGALAATKQVPIVMGGSGRLRMLVPNDASLEKGQVFAVFQPDRLELEREALALEKFMLRSRIEETRLELENRLLIMESQKAEAEAELQELKAAFSLPEVKTNPAFRKKIGESIVTAEEKIKRFGMRMEVLVESIKEEAEVSKLKLDFRRREYEFGNMKRDAEKHTLFKGSFTMTDEIEKEHGEKPVPYEFWVDGGALIGHVTDDSSYEVTLTEYPPILNRSPLDQLVMEIQGSASDSPLSAHFLEARNESQLGIGARAEKILIFQIHGDDRKRAQALAGSTSFGQIFQQLPGDCYIVPKTDLMRLLDGKEKPAKGGWATIVRAVWPEAQLVAEGYRDLAFKSGGVSDKSGGDGGP